MKYQIANNCPKNIIIQSLPSGNYDSFNKKQALEIEEGGAFQIDAVPA